MSSGTARDKLIEASYDLMLNAGYGATTVDDLCARAGVSKGSFYHFFKSKEDLGLALLDDFFGRSKSNFLSGPFRNEKDPVRRMHAFMHQTENAADTLWEQGCLLGNFATELSKTHPTVREKVSAVLHGVAEGIVEIFAPLEERYPDDPEKSPLHMAELYLGIIEGAIVLSRAHDDFAFLQRQLKAFRNYIDFLLT